MTLPADPLKWAMKAFQDDRNPQYDLYARYLAGDQPLAFATPRFRQAFGQLFDRLAYNRCEMIVDAHADRLQVSGFAASGEDDPLAQGAQAIWDANRMDVREGHVSSDAFGLGDAYVIVEVHPDRGDVQLWTQDPRNVRVHYSSESPGELDLAAKRWVTEEGNTRLNLYFTDRVEKYLSRTRTPGGLFSNTVMDRYTPEGEKWPMPLNLGDTVPVFPFANNGRTDTYGVSELRNVIALQDGTNKTFADMFVAMEFAAFPQRVLIGVDEPKTEAQELDYVNRLQRFSAGVDRFMTLFGDNSKIGEFSAVNIAQYLTVAEFLDQAFSRVTKVPAHYLGMTGGFPSGRAQRIAEAPFIAKLEDRQRAFGAVWSDVMTYALRLDGKAIEPGVLRVNWKSAAALSREDELDLAAQRSALGFPFEQILKELGYEPTQIDEILAAKQTMADQLMAQFDRGAIELPVGDVEKEVIA